MKDHTPEQLREKLRWWREQLHLATVRPPLDSERRLEVVRVCQKKIREYESLVADLPTGPEAA